ncbi:helix-turn-helix domain-containing protein [Aetokthonos hydrillicola]|nr:helix-turn-helix transcriptional regulator [Aetokthonos hydrillicola]
MVPLDWVVMIAWNKECGTNLRNLRGGRSRRDIAEGLSSLGVECSQEYIRKLELGEASSVSTKIVIALAKTLDVELVELIPVLRVELSKLIGGFS